MRCMKIWLMQLCEFLGTTESSTLRVRSMLKVAKLLIFFTQRNVNLSNSRASFHSYQSHYITFTKPARDSKKKGKNNKFTHHQRVSYYYLNNRIYKILI